jgi:class 3 adenylate cyclase
MLMNHKTRQASSRHRPQGVPIAVVLIAGMALLLLIAISLMFLAGYRIARSNTAELVRDKAELVIRSIDERIRSHLDPVEAQLDFLVEMIERERLDLEGEQELGRLLHASLAAVPQVSAVAFVAPDLRVLRAFHHRAGSPIALDDWSEDVDFVSEMADVEQAKVAYWGDLFVAEPEGTTFINRFMPIHRDGRFAGALVAGVSIYELSRFLETLGGDYDQNAFVLYGRESVLAHPKLQSVFPGLSDEHPLPGLDEFADPTLAQVWSARRLAGIEADFADGIEARVVEIAGEEFVFLLGPLEGYGNEPWLVGTYVRLDQVAPQFRRLSYIWWIGLGVLGVALALALWFGRSLSRPIRRLSSAVAQVRDLQLDPAPRLVRGPFRELNELASAYDAMIEGLRLFATYVPRPLVRRLMRQGAKRTLATEQRDLSIMFTDIVGFTSFAEHLPAGQVAHFLNRHFTLVDTCVEIEAGTLDKYMGDAVMAFWGAPETQPDHAARACRAALGVARAIRRENVSRATSGLPPMRVGIGIHSGPVVVGNIGAPSRVNYTIIGDPVNTAARLEELSRSVAVQDEQVCILVSGDTASRLSEASRRDLPLIPLGRHDLRGRDTPLDVFRLASVQ